MTTSSYFNGEHKHECLQLQVNKLLNQREHVALYMLTCWNTSQKRCWHSIRRIKTNRLNIVYLMRFLIKEQPLTDGKLDVKNRHGVIVPLLDWELMDDDITRTDSGDGIQPLSKTQAKFQLRFLLLFTYCFIFSLYIDIHCFFLILSLCC